MRAKIGRFAIVLGLAGCDLAGTNHAPVVQSLALVGDEDKVLAFTLVAADEDGDDLEITFDRPGPAELRIASVGQHRVAGMTRFEADCVLDPTSNYNGPAPFTVHVTDGPATTDAFVDVVFLPVNDWPNAERDWVATSSDTPAVIFHSTVLANDSDEADDGGEDPRTPLSIVKVDAAHDGTVMLGADTITFVPDAGFVGSAWFDYTVSDGELTNHTTVTIAVGLPNAAPTAVDDRAQSFEGTPVVFAPPTLTENDRDADDQSLAVVAVGNATHGTVQASAGIVTFVPERQFYGTAGFDYTVSDGIATDTAHVDVEVVPAI